MGRAARSPIWPCVVETAAAALLPGPLLSTVTASAVADTADGRARRWSPNSRRGHRRPRAAGSVRCPRHPKRRRLAPARFVVVDLGSLCGATDPVVSTLAAPAACTGSHWTRRAHRPSGLSIRPQRGTDLSTGRGRARTRGLLRRGRLGDIGDRRRSCSLPHGGADGVCLGGHGPPLCGHRDRIHPHAGTVRASGRRFPGFAAQGGGCFSYTPNSRPPPPGTRCALRRIPSSSIALRRLGGLDGRRHGDPTWCWTRC